MRDCALNENEQVLKIFRIVIQSLRYRLDALIEEKNGNLLHPDIISFSQFLDYVIAEYEKLLIRM
jgi:hypothetical protein